MNDLLAILEFVVTGTWHILPVFLFSVFLGVLIQELRVDKVVHTALTGRSTSAIFTATAIGAFSPFCSCTVIPVVNGLLRSGVPLAPVMAFWIASPLMDPEIFTMSIALIGTPLSIVRLAGTFILSLGAGFLTLALTHQGILKGRILRQKVASSGCCSQPVQPIQLEENSIESASTLATLLGVTPESYSASPLSPDSVNESDVFNQLGIMPRQQQEEYWWHSILDNLQRLKWRIVVQEVVSQSLPLGGLLLLAFTLEALIDRYIPQAAIASFLGNNNFFSVPLAALVGIPLYLNNVTALPIIDGLLDKGMEPGAAIAFLIAGPVTTIPAMTAVWGVVQRRIFGLYLIVGLAGAILLGLLTNLLFSNPSLAIVQLIVVLLGLLVVATVWLRVKQRVLSEKARSQRPTRPSKLFNSVKR
jgi:uncharacterized protein